MLLKDMQFDELELLSCADIAYKIIKENKTTYNTPDLFKMVCDLLDYSQSQFEDKIGDFYTSINLDKRFVVVEDTKWDITDNRSVTIDVDDDEDDDIEEEEEEEEVTLEPEEDLDDLDDDEDDDGLEDLSIIDEEDLDE